MPGRGKACERLKDQDNGRMYKAEREAQKRCKEQKRGREEVRKRERESMPARALNSIKKHETVSGSAARER